MKILIRADGGYRIGMGHVMRMLVLADKLKTFAEVTFVCRKNEEFHSGMKHIEEQGYNTLKIDESRLVDELGEIHGDCLITDSYDVDESYFKQTKTFFEITGYMDDLNKVRIYADIIINQNAYAEDLEYQVGKTAKLYLGTKYTLLREEFQCLPKREIRAEMQDLLITLGGADSRNLSEAIALKLSKAFPKARLHLAVSPYYIHQESLQKIAGEKIIIHHNPKMSELMLHCDAAISACGSTVYELCACGTPIIGLVTADNQVMAANKMDAMGAMKYARSPDEIINQLAELDFKTRVIMSEKGQGLVDGNGSSRLSEELRKFICKA